MKPVTLHIFIYRPNPERIDEFYEVYSSIGKWAWFFSGTAGFMNLVGTTITDEIYQVTEVWESADARSAFTDNNPDYAAMCERYRDLWLTETAVGPISMEACNE